VQVTNARLLPDLQMERQTMNIRQYLKPIKLDT